MADHSELIYELLKKANEKPIISIGKQRIAQLLMQQPIPTNENHDYATNEYIKKYGIPDQSKGQHLTDEFKLPNHITFSDSSSYSSPDMQGGSWKSGGQDRWAFTPSKYNLENYSEEALIDYFKNNERKNTYINLPRKKPVEGSK